MSSLIALVAAPHLKGHLEVLQPDGTSVKVNLTPTERKVLWALWCSKDAGITKHSVQEWSLTQHICNLKRKLGLIIASFPNKEPGKRCARYVMLKAQRIKLQVVHREY